jgi:hypothetical protein
METTDKSSGRIEPMVIGKILRRIVFIFLACAASFQGPQSILWFCPEPVKTAALPLFMFWGGMIYKSYLEYEKRLYL